jgi:hemerythrin-like domain-containing protein
VLAATIATRNTADVGAASATMERAMSGRDETRRALLTGAASGAWLLLASCSKQSSAPAAASPDAGSGPAKDDDNDKNEKSADAAEPVVTPAEDLMQEHGLVERVLLVYDEVARRLESHAEVDPAVITGATTLVQRFIQDYHEKNEEQFVFPALEAKKREVELVSVLRLQHQRGRELTAEIVRRTKSSKPSAELAKILREFSRMYRPHASFEDTRAFPAFRATMNDHAYRELGEKFEDREHELLGKGGFENAVADVAKLEASLGIGDLAKFTPELPKSAATERG